MRNDKHWANPFEGPKPSYAIDLDKRAVRLIAAALVVVFVVAGFLCLAGAQ